MVSKSTQATDVIKACNTIACSDCGFINECPVLEPGEKYLCRRCKHPLRSLKHDWETRVTALIVTSFILFICSNSFSFLSVEAGFQSQSANLLSGVLALINNEQITLALLVFLTIFIFPLVELSALSYVFISKFLHKKPPGIRLCLKFLVHSRAWNMLDIFMVGVLVTSVKLGESATLIPGIGLFSFACLIITLIIINLHLNFHALWSWYRADNYFAGTTDKQLFACLTCRATIGISLIDQNSPCPRCHSKVRPRVRYSLQKTSALLITAAILYIPALILPIMTVTSFGRQSQDTILSGVIYLFGGGLWFIASVVFVASIVVPILKLLTLAYLLWSVHYKHQAHRHTRQRLFKLTEFIGRWSMIDVFVITLLVALVQFGIIMNIRPEPAALAFAAVVIITMIAVETFDTRLLWDESEPSQDQCTLHTPHQNDSSTSPNSSYKIMSDNNNG
ncbi:MAG: PqiA/YebS family transporter subunit [Cellvibrionaceae bacterium]